MVCDFATELLVGVVLWRGVCSRGRCSCQHENGKSDSGPQRDFHMTTRGTAREACERVLRV